jgi:16S rRNA (uracil1498-N3)-methyltransferase
MRISRIYQQATLADGEHISLDERASHYVCSVLRLKSGDLLVLFDGSGADFTGEIVSAKRKAVEVLIKSHVLINNESPLGLHLIQGLTKGDKMDYILQKATELGVSEISLVNMKRSQFKLPEERLKKRISHWRGVVISACEQSGRSVIPDLTVYTDIFQLPTLDGLTILLDPAADSLDEWSKPSNVNCIVGPEGGFDDEERLFLSKKADYVLALGPRVLRTETASLVALSVLQSRFGDFH